MRLFLGFLMLAVLGCGSAAIAQDAPARTGVLPGEFEPQAALFLAWDADEQPLQDVIIQIIRAVPPQLRVLLAAKNDAAADHARRTLRQAGIDPTSFRLLTLPINSVWARDYGPLVTLSKSNGPQIIDPEHPRADRVDDNLLPSRLAAALHIPAARIPIRIEGGNLLSNGAGLLVATDALLERNETAGYSRDVVEHFLRNNLGARQIVFLERLVGEESGHVDMFATFVAPRTILVGTLHRNDDPLNADILNRNAARLSLLRVGNERLNVVRIPMGRRDFDIWRTYTNVCYANGTLLVPAYPKVDPEGSAAARRLYRQLLPRWKIVAIDCSRLIEWGGGLHCVTANMARLAEPNTPSRERPPQNAGKPTSTR